MAAIDPQTRRRCGRTGLTALDPDRACPGFVLFAPLYGDGLVELIALDGRSAHQWRLPWPPGLYAQLQPEGGLFFAGQGPAADPEPFPLWQHFRGGVLAEADPKGRIRWEHRDPMHHHDARRTAGGGAVYLAVGRVPPAVAARVRGGVPGSGTGGMWADVIVKVDAQGRRVWEWKAWEYLDPDLDAINPDDARDEWTHGNTVALLPGNRLLASFRNLSTVVLLDRADGRILRRLGPELLAQQHDPSLLDNGHILVFDNGAHRPGQAQPYSRVLEVDPERAEVVWGYQDRPQWNFFSPIISGARRLAGGNTLVTEGVFGRMFQVTPGGEVVWEYLNPHFNAAPDGSLTNAVFRALHYQPGEIPWL